MMTMTALPRSRPLVRADLAALPDDGHRHELIDGVLIVTPAPALGHQRVVGRLHLLLSAATPPGLEVVLAPFAVALADDTELQPDLIVARTADFTPRELPGPPLLAIEVLSPSTRRIDLTLKRDRLEAAGSLTVRHRARPYAAEPGPSSPQPGRHPVREVGGRLERGADP
ncbi:Uma2 family endonuclease [Intrasporangium sp.]|uniref:Uma2 family endonuclease n=1 Tax=Intrasporangium sp. TaxID=1925024 RepID=UPI0032215917